MAPNHGSHCLCGTASLALSNSSPARMACSKPLVSAVAAASPSALICIASSDKSDFTRSFIAALSWCRWAIFGMCHHSGRNSAHTTSAAVWNSWSVAAGQSRRTACWNSGGRKPSFQRRRIEARRFLAIVVVVMRGVLLSCRRCGPAAWPQSYVPRRRDVRIACPTCRTGGATTSGTTWCRWRGRVGSERRLGKLMRRKKAGTPEGAPEGRRLHIRTHASAAQGGLVGCPPEAP